MLGSHPCAPKRTAGKLSKKRVVGQFAVAALEGKHCLPECRNLLNQKPAVIDRRYKKAKVTHYQEKMPT